MKEVTDIAKEILKIQEDLGMTAKGMSKGMNVAPLTYNKKKNLKTLDHSFNQQNLDDLKSFLKNYVKNL